MEKHTLRSGLHSRLLDYLVPVRQLPDHTSILLVYKDNLAHGVAGFGIWG